MGWCVLKGYAGQKNLVSPENAQSPLSRGTINARLLNNGLQYSQCLSCRLTQERQFLIIGLQNQNGKGVRRRAVSAMQQVLAHGQTSQNLPTTPGLLLFSEAGKGAIRVPFPAV